MRIWALTAGAHVKLGALLVILAFFIVQGLAEVGSRGMGFVLGDQFGDFLAFGLTGFISTIGFVFVELRADLTPVATAAAAFFDWLPGGMGVVLIVVAAIAVFASTGNAGILSASASTGSSARSSGRRGFARRTRTTRWSPGRRCSISIAP